MVLVRRPFGVAKASSHFVLNSLEYSFCSDEGLANPAAFEQPPLLKAALLLVALEPAAAHELKLGFSC
jgi:hypothetical protein